RLYRLERRAHARAEAALQLRRARALPPELLPLHRAERRGRYRLRDLRRQRRTAQLAAVPRLQGDGVARNSGLRHDRSRSLPFRRLRSGESLRLRLRHGRRAHRDAQVRRRRHPAFLPKRPALFAAVPELLTMKLTLNWLKEFVDFRDAPEKLAETLTMAGLEVESLVPARAPDGSEDWIFELGVTPNRGDCLGVIGIAREIAALKAGRPKPQARKAAAQKAAAPAPVKVEIQSPRACQRYSAQAVKAIRLGPSPDWLRFRLEAAGIRAINNVVDITNYVMVETGQPLHAFDLDRLAAKRIVVRQAKEIATFVTLDDVERRLAPEDLLICDGDVPVALAGVMGGRDSEVHQGTT